MSWDKFGEQLEKGPIHAIGANWKILVFVLILLGITTCGVAVVIKPFSAVSGTLDSDNVKHNYEWFKLRHESVLAIDVQIKQTQATLDQFKAEAGPRDKWHREDREESSRLGAVLLGLKTSRASQAAEYNARSLMVNRAIFKGHDTPTTISVEVAK